MKNLSQKIGLNKTQVAATLVSVSVWLLFLMLVGCDKNEGFLGDSNSTSRDGLIKDHQVIEIDGCEYILYDATRGYSGYGFFTHKGNCKNH